MAAGLFSDVVPFFQSQPIAIRKARRAARKPKRYVDKLPEPPPTLLPLQAENNVHLDLAMPKDAAPHRTFKVLRSATNTFGLSRQYYTTKLPSHDPEEAVTLDDLCLTGGSSVGAAGNSLRHDGSSPEYYPYPNRESFLLGDWYIHGVQKSQDSFKKLTSIIGDPAFDPSHIRNTNWAKINEILGSSEVEDDREWMDADAGWVGTPIKLLVPFRRQKTKIEGKRKKSQKLTTKVETYVGAKLYHRSLVAVIKEKIVHAGEHFHYEPYELLWTCPGTASNIPVHGELYTSKSFLQAHQELQDSPGEPNCSLQRVVVALMFWSDATHLTSFGNAKLWPLYLFFGNESKYRRCKPSCNLCCHVAYFEDVCLLLLILLHHLHILFRCQMNSRTSQPIIPKAKAQLARSTPTVGGSSYTNS
jgi:hypothetical protein